MNVNKSNERRKYEHANIYTHTKRINKKKHIKGWKNLINDQTLQTHENKHIQR